MSIMRTSNAHLFSTAVVQGKHNDPQVMDRTSQCCQIEISYLNYLKSQCLSAADTGFTKPDYKFTTFLSQSYGHQELISDEALLICSVSKVL